MSLDVAYRVNQASPAEIAAHLLRCDHAFYPALSARVDIPTYARKIYDRSARFEAWQDNHLVGLVAAYDNDPEGQSAFVTSVSVLPTHQGRGIAAVLMRSCIDHVRRLSLVRIKLEVDQRSAPAIALYRSLGFTTDRTHGTALTMSMTTGRPDR